MKRIGLIVWMASVLAVVSNGMPEAAWAGSTSPGKSSVHVSDPLALIASQVTYELSGTILKGKRKQVLMIHGMLQSTAEFPPLFGHILSMSATVNGYDTEPYTSIGASDCSTFCQMTGTWWMDLDAAEATHPGQFLGKALEVKLVVFDNNFPAPADQYAVSMNAVLVKK